MNPSREEALVALALMKPAAERAAFLERECGGDAGLRQRIEELLAAHESPDPFLEAQTAPSGIETVLVPLEEGPGTVIGRYKLLEQIGEGGFGVVYVAEQKEPVKRRVALKIIKLGMDTKQVVARFEAERQALALMDHPNIAKVLDAGATDTGRPYFVMELVKGIPITRYCDQEKLATRERLDLFIQVCHAIQHAHQKGIIHRDIKPSNILVTLHDGVPVPKVIDFGIAKATQQKLTEKTLHTQLEQFIGTPAYMSPEQAEMSGLDIDTRSDIYSLGVLLYELLVGKTPFDSKELLAAGLDEIRRTIREKEPARPSTRLSLMGKEELTTTTQRRGAEAPKLIGLLRGDLDWIVMKCLEKDRTRRYEAANALARDIECYLNHEPIMARPPSASYRVGKFVRRNKVLVGAGAAVALALVVGIGFSTGLAIWANRERQVANRERKLAVEARVAETKAKQNEEQQKFRTRQHLYAADMSLTQAAISDANLGLARNLLSAYLPQPGEKDMRGFEWRYFWNMCQGDQLSGLVAHSNFVNSVVFSPDGKILASGSRDGTVKLWEAATLRPIATLQATNEVLSLAFSPNGSLLAVGGERFALVLDVNMRRVTGKIACSSSRVTFSPLGKLLAVAGPGSLYGYSGGMITLWDCSTMKQVLALRDAGSRAAFSPDGTLLATANWNTMIKIWNVAAGELVKSLPNVGNVVDIAFSPDGRYLLAACGDEGIKLFDVGSGVLLQNGRLHRLSDRKAVFAPSGAFIATSGTEQTIFIYSFPELSKIAVLKGHGNEIDALAFSPSGRLLASGSKDNMVMLWDPFSQEDRSAIQGPAMERWMRHPVFSPDGKYIAGPAPGLLNGTKSSTSAIILAPKRAVVIWEYSRQIRIAELPGEDFAAAFTADGNGLVTVDESSNPCELKYWDLTSLSLQKKVPLSGANGKFRYVLQMSPDGRYVAGDGIFGAAVWKTQTGERLFTLSSPMLAIAFSQDSQTAVYGTTSSHFKHLNLPSGTSTSVKGHNDLVYAVAFSPSGKWIASGSIDGNAKLWDAATRNELATFKGHKAGIIRLAFAPDGKTLATLSDDITIKMWSLDTYREMATFYLPAKAVEMAFSPDGQSLAYLDNDGNLRMMQAPSEPDVAGKAAKIALLVGGVPEPSASIVPTNEPARAR